MDRTADTQRPEGGAARTTAAPATAPAAHRRYKLLDECRELVVARLAEVVGDALARMGDHLADEALRVGSSDHRQALLEALSVVREHRLEIERRFRRSFKDVFERRMFARRDPDHAAEPAGARKAMAELSLVSDDEIDERLAVDRLSHKARRQLDPEEVLGIRARFGALLDRDWFDENAHPVAPDAIFEALKSALSELAPRHEVKNALLDAFEPHVSASLNDIYARVNARLVENRILPIIRPQARVVAPGAGARPPHAAGSGDLAAAPHHASAPYGVGPGVAGGSGAAFHAAGMQGAMSLASALGLPGVEPMSAQQASATLDSMLARLEQGQASARLSAARMLGDPDMFGVADLPFSDVNAPLLDSLSTLQADAGAQGATGAGAHVFQQLSAHVRDQGSPLDKITVEIVSIVFDYISADRRLPDAIKHQLMRLQVVAVKAALIDRSFFARRQHPMRRLIDRITEMGADPDAEVDLDSSLMVGVRSVIDRIIAGFDRDLAIFEQSLEWLEALSQTETERRAGWLAQQTADAEQQERAALARDEAHAQIALRLPPDAPGFVRDFLSRRWAAVIATARTGAGYAGPSPDDALRVVDDLLWSIAPKLPGEVVQLAQRLPKLIQALMQGVRQIEYPDDEQRAFFDELLRAHTAAISAAKLPVPPPSPRRVPEPAARLPEPTPSAPDPDDELLEPLKRGDRIELTEEDGTPQRYKLAWVSPMRKLFVLSRYPHDAKSLPREELATLFQRGLARVAPDDDSVLDRAIDAVAHELPEPALR